MRIRAVVFDLWNTLVDWPIETSNRLRETWAWHLGITLDRLDELWYDPAAYRRRESSPLAPVVAELCAAVGSDASVDELVALRVDVTRCALQPRDGVLSTLSELRRRGLRLGLVSNCTEDVALVWGESALASSFDAVVFSATAGCVKPDRRIYELAAQALSVEPETCIFVGDGANDEIPGAAAAGMRAVLFERNGDEHAYAEDWAGERIRAIPDVVSLVA